MNKILLFVFALLVGFSVQAYELGTHARLTQQAYLQSVLSADISLYQDLGIDEPGASKPFGEIYLDVSGGRIETRRGSEFSEKAMPKGVASFSVQGWLMRGAVREDDYLSNFGAPNPQDDDYGGFNRPLNHFFDPINNQGLSVPILGTQVAAPNWATGSANTFADPPIPDTHRRNHFTVLDAREALFRALTGKSGSWQTVAANKAERDKYWATVFRALGDVVHLVQDMGQPQHTRNDPHSGAKYDGFAPLWGHKSVYEAYIEARAKQESFVVKPSQTNGPTPPPVPTEGLKYTGYPIPAFDDYASYFSTWHQDGADPLVRRGLADYSNRGFFSEGTNFGNTGNYNHPNPDPSARDYIRGLINVDWNGERLPNGGAIIVVHGVVTDSVVSGQADAALSSYGLWDQFLEEEGSQPGYTLTRANYDDMADLLIPRTVAYSAGLINYFFRGRLELAIDNYTGQSVTLRFTNKAATDTIYNQNNLNELAVVYRYYSATGEQTGTSVDAVSLVDGDDVAPGAQSAESYTFNFDPPIPADAENLVLQLVYHGKLGKENDAVAVGAIEMSSPGFIFHPSHLPDDGLAGSRYMFMQDGHWVLSSQTGLVSGNIDWKGWYVNGKPTKALSWNGPSTRYFSGGGFAQEIFYNGEIYSVAPYPVLGAALNRDDYGDNWIVVICNNGSNDIVLRRPFTKNTSPDMRDPVLNPQGWESLGEFAPKPGLGGADRAWFFNGDGTQAQTMRESFVPLSGGLERIRISIENSVAQIQYLGNYPGASAYGVAFGNGCISHDEQNSHCSGTSDNPTGYRTYDILVDKQYHNNTGKNGKYIIAVDYINNKESLAVLTSNEVFDQIKSHKSDTHGGGVCYKDQYGHDSASVNGTAYSVEKTSSIYDQRKSETLSLASDTIDGFSIRSLIWHRSVARPDGHQNITPGGGYDYENHIVHDRGQVLTKKRIDYMDLRSGVILSSVEITEEAYLSRQDAFNVSLSEVPIVVLRQDRATTQGYEFRMNGFIQLIYSNKTELQGGTITSLNDDVNSWFTSTLCNSNSSSIDNIFVSLSGNMDVALPVPAFGIATDLARNVFVSMQYRDASGILKAWNILSNGELSSITGVQDVDVSYFPIGLR